MAFDQVIADQLSALTLSSAQQGVQLNSVIDRNLTQSLGVINGNLLHQHGGVGDDPGLMAALQTAAGSPRQGAIQPGGA